MSLVYLQSMYSESCFSECSRNKQQALSLLRVSKLESVVRRVFHGAVLLQPGPWQGSAPLAVLLKGTEGTHAHAHPRPLLPTSNQASSPPHAMGILAKLSLLLAELCHIFGCLQPPAPEGAGMLSSSNLRDRHVQWLSGGVWLYIKKLHCHEKPIEIQPTRAHAHTCTLLHAHMQNLQAFGGDG